MSRKSRERSLAGVLLWWRVGLGVRTAGLLVVLNVWWCPEDVPGLSQQLVQRWG